MSGDEMEPDRTLHEFWKNRSWKNSKPHIKTVDYYALKCFLMETKPKMLIEIGCGLGRFFPLYKGIEQVHATDMVSERIEHCKTLGHDYTHYIVDITKEIVPLAFDTIVSSQVLLHIPPKHIEKAIANMAMMTQSGGLWWHCVSYTPDKLSPPDADYSPETPTANSFSHPYPELIQKVGMEIVSMDTVHFFNGAENTIFVCRREA